jgi:PAS domain S-box-containing protein
MRSIWLHIARRKLRVQIVTILFFIFSIALVWHHLKSQERRHIEMMARLAATGIRDDLHADVSERLAGQLHLAHLWELEAPPSKEDWETSARHHLRTYDGTVLVEYVDSSYADRWIYPADSASVLRSLHQTVGDERNRVFRLAREKRKPALTRVFALPTGEKVVLAVVPIFSHGEFAGFIVDVLNAQRALAYMLRDVAGLGYEFLVLQDGAPFFSIHEKYRKYEPGDVYVDTPTDFEGWTVRVWPGEEVLASQRSWFPVWVVTAMALLGVAVAATIHAREVAREQAKIAQAANKSLMQENAERRRAEEAARRSEAKFARILDISADAIISVNSEQRVVLFNQGAERMFQYRAEEVLGKPLDLFLPGAARNLHREHVARFAQEHSPTRRMCERRPIHGLRKDGTEFPLEATISKLDLNGDTTFTAILRDVSERVRAEEALRRAHDELEERVQERTSELAAANESLRQLSGRILASQEEERRRIARELHDSTAQMLVLALIDLERLQNSSAAAESPGREIVNECIASVQRAAGELRTVSYRLHPPMLEEFGLASSLRWYVNGFSKRLGISIEVDVDPNLGRFDRDVEMAVFRIVQEALTNVHRHSHATEASIKVWLRENELCLDIADRGTGIRPDVLGTSDKAPMLGVGIAGMRERVRQLHGKFEIQSGAEGTLIRARFPIARAEVNVPAQGILN